MRLAEYTETHCIRKCEIHARVSKLKHANTFTASPVAPPWLFS